MGDKGEVGAGGAHPHRLYNQPSPLLQCNSATLPALPEQPVALHPSIPIAGLIPPSLTNTNDIVVLGTDQHFQFIVFVSHTVCVGVQAFQMCS